MDKYLTIPYYTDTVSATLGIIHVGSFPTIRGLEHSTIRVTRHARVLPYEGIHLVMVSSDQAPIYNLKAVVQETGLKPDTLRAWERRYGLPNPQRTASGHRLYSQRDIDIVKWLINRQREGLAIRRAVDLWRQLESSQGDPLATSAQSTPEPVLSLEPAQRDRINGANNDNLGEIRRLWIDACLQFDERAADQILSQAFTLFATETVCIHVLQRGLSEIGAGWYQGRITVQQEHFASALAIRKLEAMLAGTPAPYRRPRLIIGCPPAEEHTFVPIMLSLLLRRRGYDVVYLGADIPLRSLETTIDTTRPDLVVLTAQQLSTAANLLEMAQFLASSGHPLAYGGTIFSILPELTRVIPGHYLGDRLDRSLEVLDRILLNPQVGDADRQIAPEMIAALDNFRQSRADIEADIWRRIGDTEIDPRHLSIANVNLGRDIQAALQLGGLEFLGHNLEWVETLLTGHFQIPAQQLYRYLELYLEAAINNLDRSGEPIVNWLSKVIGESQAGNELDRLILAGRSRDVR